MKTLTIFMITFLISVVVEGQEKQPDKVYLHTGDIWKVSVIELTDTGVKYKFQGEDLVNNISKLLVERIEFSSGRTQKITDKVVIEGEADWEKVQITNIAEEIKGLTRKGEVHSKSTGAWGAASNAKKVYMKAEEKLKKEAAKLGAHSIYMKDLVVKDGDMMSGQWAKSMLSGVAYGYK